MILTALTALALGHPCAAPLARVEPVPAPLVFHTSCGAFQVHSTGLVSGLPRHWLARHGGGTGRRFGAGVNLRRTRAGAYILRRRSTIVWRSHALYPKDGGSVAFGPRLFAFAAYRRGVFLTDLAGSERLVVRGRGLFPIGFTARGTLFVAGRGSIRAVGKDGQTIATFRYRVRNGFAFDDRRDRLFFVNRDRELVAAADRGLQTIRKLPASFGSIGLVDGLLVFFGAADFVAMSPGGSVVATATWRHRRLRILDSGISVSTDRRSFAFRLSDARPGSRAGVAEVLVVGAGEAHARLLYRHRVGAQGCAVGARLSWNGRYLLYQPYNDAPVLLDASSGRGHSLAGIGAALPKLTAHEQPVAYWRSDFSP